MQKIFETIRRARVQLRAMWRSMDPENTKVVDEKEFREGLSAMNTLLDSPITVAQVEP